MCVSVCEYADIVILKPVLIVIKSRFETLVIMGTGVLSKKVLGKIIKAHFNDFKRWNAEVIK